MRIFDVSLRGDIILVEEMNMHKVLQTVRSGLHWVWWRIVRGESHIDYQMRLFTEHVRQITEKSLPNKKWVKPKVVGLPRRY